MSKKLISVAIIYLLLLQMFSINQVASAEKTQVPQTAYALRADTLFDELEIKDYFPTAGESVTRACFLATLMSILGYESSAPEATSCFKDVKGEFSGVINKAVEMKIISTGEYFRPEESVTYAEALKMCLTAIGYEYECNANGGYPVGVIRVAENIELSEKLNLSVNDKLSASDAYVIMYNFLNTEIVNVDCVRKNDNGVKLSFSKNSNTVLDVIYDVSTINGIISENSRTSLYKSKSDMRGSVKINSKVYYAKDCIEDYVGYNVIAFFSEEKNEIIAAFPEKTNICRIDGDFVEAFNNDRLIYEEAGEVHKLKLESDYDVLFNGKAYSLSMTQDFIDTWDAATLVDNDNDGIYELVCVEDISYTLIEKINYVDKIIYTHSDFGNNADLSDIKGKYYITSENGEPISIYDLEPGMLIEAVISEDGLYGKISVCSKSINGKITARNVEDNLIAIDEVEYRTSNEFSKGFTNLKIGDKGNFYIGSNQRVVMYEKGSSALQYGYIIKIAKGNALSGYEIKMLCQTGAVKIFDLAKKVILDGQKKSDEEAAQIIQNAVVTNFVRYKANSSMEINAVDTAAKDERVGVMSMGTLNGDDSQDDNSLVWYQFSEDESYTSYLYKTTSKALFPKVNLAGAKVFVIPANEEDKSDDSKYCVGSGDVFSHDQEIPRNKIKLFDVDENGNCNALVYEGNASDTEFKSSSFQSGVIEKVRDESNEDDIYARKLYLIVNGKYEEYFLSDDILESSLKTAGGMLCAGDIIRYKAEGNVITNMVVDFDASIDVMAKNRSSYTAPFNGSNASYQYQSGKIYSINEAIGNFTPEADLTEPIIDREYDFSWNKLRNHQIPKDCIVKVVIHYNDDNGLKEVRKREVSVADLTEVETYLEKGEAADYAVLRQNALDARLLVIYKLVK